MYSDSQITKQIRKLIKRISGTEKDSIWRQASDFFIEYSKKEAKLDSYKSRINELKSKLAQDSNQQNCTQYRKRLVEVKKNLASFTDSDLESRLVRHDTIVPIAREILALAESFDYEDTLRKSARFLGTLQLINPTEGNRVAEHNERTKPVYKAILCLRLFDQLYLDGLITESYIIESLGKVTPEKYQAFINEENEDYQKFTEKVKIPLIITALIQDIGNLHPDAKRILFGENSTLNPFRTLEQEHRKALLQINYRQTRHYISLGIGVGKYYGNYKVERDEFDEREIGKVAFMQGLLKRWANPKSILGNLIKVPQIYTSIILSTKDNYDYRALPKVYQILKINVERKHCHGKIVECLYRITGMFPMGYGITYLPKDSTGNSLDRYEYAIVTRLYPNKLKQPECRVATRSLSFISRGQDLRIEPDVNLYFPETAKKLSTMSKERLNEILELLASNYQERKNLDVIPRCWHGEEFFSLGKYQNLWNKVSDN